MQPALELAELLRSGRVHARELVEASFVRLEEREGCINAFCSVDAEGALAAAEKISPDDPRPFAGVPIAIKDATPERGKPMRIGSALFKEHVPDHDGASIRRLREAGFIPSCRTTTPEFGILPTTEPLPLFHGDDGLPLGAQLVGPPAGETLLLALAGQLERASPWRQRLSGRPSARPSRTTPFEGL